MVTMFEVNEALLYASEEIRSSKIVFDNPRNAPFQKLLNLIAAIRGGKEALVKLQNQKRPKNPEIEPHVKESLESAMGLILNQESKFVDCGTLQPPLLAIKDLRKSLLLFDAKTNSQRPGAAA
jgi:hypothetical protein